MSILYPSSVKNTMLSEVIDSCLYGPRFNANDYCDQGNVRTIRGTDLAEDGELKYEQIPLAKLDDKTVKTHKLEDGDLVVITTAECGNTAVFRVQETPYIASAYAVRLRLNDKGIPDYIKYYFQSEKSKREISKYVRKATVANLPGSDIFKLKIQLPIRAEQQKIADFLSAVDNKIRLLKEKHTLLQQYKKGVMQKLFSQEICFKDDNGQAFPDWKILTLSKLAKKNKSKNINSLVKDVLTNSAKSGIVPQGEYFTKDIANQGNLDGYTVVQLDDFVYNPRISELAPVGPISRNHIGEGVMSPLYTVFRFNDNDLLDYIEQYFATSKWHRYMHSVANFGARHDRMNIGSEDFYRLPIPVPSKPERDKIVAFIKALEAKVNAVQQQIELTQTFKKGLLQQMFV